jgi:dolichol-phosphate mannosyltransferase
VETKSRHPATLSVVAPVFNEARIIAAFVDEAQQQLCDIPALGGWEIVLVDDGSTDGSAEILDAAAQRYPGRVKVLHLARNFGHTAAVSAGLDHASGDAVVLMDSDLQDDPKAIPRMVEKWREGYRVVYAIRSSREEPVWKRLLFTSFYRLLRMLSDTPFPVDAGNYSLMDRRVVEILQCLPERNRYLPGVRAWAGFRQVGLAVPRRPRHDDRPRVGIRGLWRLSMNAIFSFSYVPLLIFRLIGAFSLGLSLLLMSYAIGYKLFSTSTIPAWTSQIVAVSFFGGLNIFGIGILGEYIARIYDELKGRPVYVIDRRVAAAPDACDSATRSHSHSRNAA